ncbi:MAG TPA: hypothetical protein VH988_05005 [Thermoanaerobaculia bacterium]|nr:hypothetical protein [Thermoanaerobaculia bacterium]
MRFLAALPLVTLLAVPDALFAKAQDTPVAPAGKKVDAIVVICQEGDAHAPSAWDRNILLSIGRTLLLNGTVKSIGIRHEPCEAHMPDATCFAGPKVLLCRSAALERILKASAWMIATYIGTGRTNYEEFRVSHPKAVANAFRYADGAPGTPPADKLVEAMRLSELTPAGNSPPGKDDSGIESLTALYQHIVDINMAVLLGHESFHILDACLIDQASLSEESGLFTKVVDVQLKGSLFCPRNPTLVEVKADRCALRFLRKRDQRAQAHGEEGAAFDFTRRAAADMVVFQILTGWRHLEGEPPGKGRAVVQKQYLYESLRALLMAAEINGQRPNPAACGEAASLFVHGVQEAFKACSQGAGGIVPDEILAKLPRGVEESWNGNKPWTDQSWSCRIDGDRSGIEKTSPPGERE